MERYYTFLPTVSIGNYSVIDKGPIKHSFYNLILTLQSVHIQFTFRSQHFTTEASSTQNIERFIEKVDKGNLKIIATKLNTTGDPSIIDLTKTANTKKTDFSFSVAKSTYQLLKDLTDTTNAMTNAFEAALVLFMDEVESGKVALTVKRHSSNTESN